MKEWDDARPAREVLEPRIAILVWGPFFLLLTNIFSSGIITRYATGDTDVYKVYSSTPTGQRVYYVGSIRDKPYSENFVDSE